MNGHGWMNGNRSMKRHRSVKDDRSMKRHRSIKDDRSLNGHGWINGNRSMKRHRSVKDDRSLNGHGWMNGGRSLKGDGSVKGQRRLTGLFWIVRSTASSWQKSCHLRKHLHSLNPQSAIPKLHYKIKEINTRGQLAARLSQRIVRKWLQESGCVCTTSTHNWMLHTEESGAHAMLGYSSEWFGTQSTPSWYVKICSRHIMPLSYIWVVFFYLYYRENINRFNNIFMTNNFLPKRLAITSVENTFSKSWRLELPIMASDL